MRLYFISTLHGSETCDSLSCRACPGHCPALMMHFRRGKRFDDAKRALAYRRFTDNHPVEDRVQVSFRSRCSINLPGAAAPIPGKQFVEALGWMLSSMG